MSSEARLHAPSMLPSLESEENGLRAGLGDATTSWLTWSHTGPATFATGMVPLDLLRLLPTWLPGSEACICLGVCVKGVGWGVVQGQRRKIYSYNKSIKFNYPNLASVFFQNKY